MVIYITIMLIIFQGDGMKGKYVVRSESRINEVKFVHSRLAAIVRDVLYSLFIEILR